MNHTGASLATIIEIGKSQLVITADWVQQCIECYQETDDVFQKNFLQGVIFRGGQDDSSISSEAELLLQGFGMQWHQFLISGSPNQPLPGPYVLLDGSLHKPFRLYSDENAAFFSTTR